MRPSVWQCDNRDPHEEHVHQPWGDYFYGCPGVPAGPDTEEGP